MFKSNAPDASLIHILTSAIALPRKGFRTIAAKTAPWLARIWSVSTAQVAGQLADEPLPILADPKPARETFRLQGREWCQIDGRATRFDGACECDVLRKVTESGRTY